MEHNDIVREGAEMTRLLVILNVAFNKCVRKLVKRSFSKTIDVQFGIYTGEEYKDWLTINLKPSHGWKDWIINLFALPKRLDGGWVHGGYWKEIMHYWPDFIGIVHNDPELTKALQNGVIISGRSKGAAEAVLVAYRLWFPGIKMLVGAIEPPMCVSYQLSKRIEGTIGEVLWTCYKNDIVPGIPKWFDFPGTKYQLGDRRLGLSIKDHTTSTTDYEIMRKWIEA